MDPPVVSNEMSIALTAASDEVVCSRFWGYSGGLTNWYWCWEVQWVALASWGVTAPPSDVYVGSRSIVISGRHRYSWHRQACRSDNVPT